MARAGRKRKDVARLAGRRDWRQLVEDPSLVTKWHSARDNFLQGLGGNPRLASQAGKLFALRHLTALEIEAADRWTLLLSEYDRLILGMARTPPSLTLERVPRGVGYPHGPDEIKRFLARFNGARDAVLMAGTPALRSLNRLCRDEAASSVLDEARKGLAQLVMHFRLDSATQP
jgi:hypothetical protein